MLKNLLVAAAMLSLILPGAPASADEVTVTGIVFDDADSNGVFDDGEAPLVGTSVSDGREVIVTDERGRYRIETEADFVFISVPGSHHAADNKYYRKIGDLPGEKTGRKEKLKKRADFPLRRNAGSSDGGKFTFAFVTDTHAAYYRRAKEGVVKAYSAVADLKPALVIHGGDVIFDALKTSDENAVEGQYKLYKSQLAPVIKSPFYHTIGNHDVFAWAAPSDTDPIPPLYGKAMFKKYFGPTYYSFNYGRCHFVVLDSIGRTKTEAGETTYHGFIDDVQVEWLRKDLAAVGKEKPIIIVTHIPMINALASLFGTKSEVVPGPDGERTPKHQIHNLALVLGDVLRGYNFKLALAGHYHTFEEVHWKSNEHDTRFIVGGSICGEWWKGDHRLGLSSWPEGFTLIEVDGEKFAASYIPYGWKGTEEQ